MAIGRLTVSSSNVVEAWNKRLIEESKRLDSGFIPAPGRKKLDQEVLAATVAVDHDAVLQKSSPIEIEVIGKLTNQLAHAIATQTLCAGCSHLCLKLSSRTDIGRWEDRFDAAVKCSNPNIQCPDGSLKNQASGTISMTTGSLFENAKIENSSPSFPSKIEHPYTAVPRRDTPTTAVGDAW